MVSLEDTHPNINRQLHSGDFVAQRQQSYGFAYTACDQVIEQTANRDTKTKGGLTGFRCTKVQFTDGHSHTMSVQPSQWSVETWLVTAV